MRFANPEFFLLLAFPVVVYLIGATRFRFRFASLRFSDFRLLKGVRSSRGLKKLRILKILRAAALLFFITALARPQSGTTHQEILSEGIDIMLAIDISGSMRAEDFQPDNRLEVVKRVVSDFINGRMHDRIGMVVFAADSFTQCPLTHDYGILEEFLQHVEIGMVNEDQTAIGMALANCINRLRDSEADSKIIILLTDGVNNAGKIDPLHAARLAETMDVKIYSIGVGSRGTAMVPVSDPIFGKRMVPMQVEIDEKTLKEISDLTGGAYFRATDPKKLEEIYDIIDEMEKTEIKTQEYTEYSELFYWFILAGLPFLVLEIFLSQTRLRKLP